MFFRRLFLALSAMILTACGTLQVGIEPATPHPVSVPTLTATKPVLSPAPDPTGTAEPPVRINFPSGGTNFTFTTRLGAGVPERYVLQILAMQKMTITTSAAATIQVFDAQNRLVAPASASPTLWQGTLPQTGDYMIMLQGIGLNSVSIDIPPPG